MNLRVAIAGCGLIAGGPVREGRTISGNHAAACRAIPEVELVAAADPDRARREAFGRTWDVPRVFASPGEMIEVVAPDIVIVATPPETHEAICLDAIRQGVRGLLCEKPFTGSASRALKVTEEARARGCKLVVNFTRRWDASHRALAARIGAGDLGDVRQVHASYTGTMRGNGAHFVDTLLMLTPGTWGVEWASAIDGGADDAPIDALLSSSAGARAYVSAVRGAEYFVFEIVLFGTKGRARLLFQGNDLRIDRPKPHPDFPGYLYLGEESVLPQMTIAKAFVVGLSTLVAAVRDGSAIDVPPDAYVESLELVDSIVARATHVTGAE